MKQYLDLLREVKTHGKTRTDRTGTGTISMFGTQTRYNLKEGFPAVTTKRLAWKSVVSELLWFLEGSTDERRLAEILFELPREQLTEKKTIWTENADNQGKSLGYENSDLVKELGPVYGEQWVNFRDSQKIKQNSKGINQIKEVISLIKNNPDSRRIIFSAWNPDVIREMALPPCHVMAQFYVHDGELSCQLYQRSADLFLGVPFNVASYALLTYILAQICELEVGDFIHTIGDAHIYSNHIEQVNEQLTRVPLRMPKLVLPEFNSLEELLELKTSDFTLQSYRFLPPIKAPMAV